VTHIAAFCFVSLSIQTSEVRKCRNDAAILLVQTRKPFKRENEKN
jgi:hypothetical protein